MISIKKNKLKQGMVLAQNVVGANSIVLRAGTILSERFINLLSNPGLFPNNDIFVTEASYNMLLVETVTELKGHLPEQRTSNVAQLTSSIDIEQIDDENYKTSDDIVNINQEINIPGSLTVNGDIKNCSSLFVSGQLTIYGDIMNSNITAKDNIRVNGNIINDSKSFHINSFNTIAAENIQNAKLNADYINVNQSIRNSEIIADKEIKGPAAMYIQESKLQAGLNIIIGNVKEGSILMIFSEKQAGFIRRLLKIEKKLNEFSQEIAPLQQSIQVFRILREKVNELTPEKRGELIDNIKKVKVKMEKKKYLHEQFATLRIEVRKIKESRSHNPIIVEEEVERGTRVIIDNSSLVVRMRDKGVVFYKKGIIIMGKKDKEWGRLV